MLEVVRSNYDTLTLKLQDGLDQFERYSEQPKEVAFFKELVRDAEALLSTFSGMFFSQLVPEQIQEQRSAAVMVLRTHQQSSIQIHLCVKEADEPPSGSSSGFI